MMQLMYASLMYGSVLQTGGNVMQCNADKGQRKGQTSNTDRLLIFRIRMRCRMSFRGNTGAITDMQIH